MTVDWRRFLSATRGRLIGTVETYLMDDYLPVCRRDDDLFLVEFPKSGVTWLTFLLANVNALLSEDPRKVTFFNINDFVPDVQVARHLGAPLLRVPGYRCFKSHSPYTRRYRKVFYLVRDPRHVMVSYWAFLSSLGGWRGTLEELVTHPEYGIGAWNRHVTGWLDRVDAAASFTLVRYEDLIADTAGELKRLYQLLGWSVGDDVLTTAVQRSGMEEMRAAETIFNSGHPALKDFKFVRPGQSGGPRQAISGALRGVIEKTAGSTMQRLGYLPALPSPSASANSTSEA